LIRLSVIDRSIDSKEDLTRPVPLCLKGMRNVAWVSGGRSAHGNKQILSIDARSSCVQKRTNSVTKGSWTRAACGTVVKGEKGSFKP
jgi:hypothetical protein